MRPNKYEYLFIIQGHWSYGWEDESAHENRAEARADLRAYRDNQPEVAHRMIQRRELIREATS